MHRRLRSIRAAALVALLVVCAPAARGVLAQSFDGLQSPENEKFLANAPIVRLGKTLGGVTRSRQVTLELDGVTRFAVWKTIDQKRAGVTALRGASEIGFQDTWKTEIPAYELDKLLGLKMVPTSISRIYQGRQGALTAWVDLGMPEEERVKKQIAPPDSEDWSRKMANVRLFDNLIYNVDRHANNIYITKTWDIILIDHSRSFRQHHELLTESELRRFSRSLLAALEKLDRATLNAKMSKYIDRYQIEAVLARRDRILARAQRLVKEQGEAAVLFP
jgi:hypothetical protein